MIPARRYTSTEGLMATIYLIQGEQKVLRFEVTDGAGQEVDLTGVGLALKIVQAEDLTTVMCEKVTGDFDVTQKARGIVKCTLTSADLATAGNWLGQLKMTFVDATIDKSVRFDLVVETAIA